MKKFYLQVNKDNIITDCIDYPHEEYIEYVGEVPPAVHGGWFKLIDGEIIEIIELKPKDTNAEIEELRQKLELQQLAIDDLLINVIPTLLI